MTEKKTTKKVATKAPAVPMIHGLMVAIMRDVDGLVKDNTSKGGFKYRGIDDVYNMMHDILSNHGVFMLPRVVGSAREERKSNAGNTLIYTMLTVEYDFVASDGSRVTAGPVIGEAFDTGDKSCMKALAIAHKYIMLQTFLVPTNLSVDPDAETHDVAPREEVVKAPEVKMASRSQVAIIDDYRKMDGTTGEMNEYLDKKGDSLTFKQAKQIIEKIEGAIQ